MFERNDIDLSVIKPKIQATISGLQRMKTRDGPFLAKRKSVVTELEINMGDNETKVTEAKNKFIDELIQEMENRLGNAEVITNLSALNISQVPPDSLSCHGDHQVSKLA